MKPPPAQRTAPGRPPLGYLVAKFHRDFPGLFHAPHWPTRDGVIPFRLFFLLLGASTSLDAAETHRGVIATGLAIAIAFGGKDGGVRSAERDLLRLAHPEVRD